MRVKKLDHYNIVANVADLERVKTFYAEILGFEEGSRPDFGLVGAWLYKDGVPLVHLAAIDSPDLKKTGLYETTTGCLHHIAFDCEGFEDFKALLEEKGVEYEHFSVPEWNIEQLFFHDPAGARIELNFKNG